MGMLDDGLGVRIWFVEWMLAEVPATVVFISMACLVFGWVGRTAVREVPGADEIIVQRRRAFGWWMQARGTWSSRSGWTVSLWIGAGLLPPRLRPSLAVAVLPSGPEAVAALTGATPALRAVDQPHPALDLTCKAGVADRLGHHPSLRRRTLARGTVRRHGARAGRRRGLVSSNGVVLVTFAATLFTVVVSNTIRLARPAAPRPPRWRWPPRAPRPTFAVTLTAPADRPTATGTRAERHRFWLAGHGGP